MAYIVEKMTPWGFWLPVLVCKLKSEAIHFADNMRGLRRMWYDNRPWDEQEKGLNYGSK